MELRSKFLAHCKFCQQKQEVNILHEFFDCIYCHVKNTNPFYVYTEERNLDMQKKQKVIAILDEKGLKYPTKQLMKEFETLHGEKVSRRYVNQVRRDYKEKYEETVQPEKQKKSGGSGGFWEVKIDEVHECSKVQKFVEVHIQPEVRSKVSYLMERFKSIEWLAYLLGEKIIDNEDTGQFHYLVKDIHIPSQKVTAGSVTDIDCPEYHKLPIIGVSHSHHGMGNGFSGTDHEYINSNHDLSLVFTNRHPVAGQVRVSTPCGSVKIIEDVKIIKLDNGDITDEFKDQIEKNIHEPHRTKPAKPANQQYQNWITVNPLNADQQKYNNGVSVKEVYDSMNDNWEVPPEDRAACNHEFVSCPNCNALIDDDSKKCEYCHVDLM